MQGQSAVGEHTASDTTQTQKQDIYVVQCPTYADDD